MCAVSSTHRTKLEGKGRSGALKLGVLHRNFMLLSPEQVR